MTNKSTKPKIYKVTEKQFKILQSLSSAPLGKPDEDKKYNILKTMIHNLLTPFIHIPLLILMLLFGLESTFNINLKWMMGIFTTGYMIYVFKIHQESWQGIRYIFERMRIVIQQIEENNQDKKK